MAIGVGKDVSVVLISGTNDLGAFDRLEVDDTAMGSSIGWQERTIAGDLGYLQSLAHYLEAAGFSDVEGRIAGMADEQVREMHRSVMQDGECTEGDFSPTP